MPSLSFVESNRAGGAWLLSLALLMHGSRLAAQEDPPAKQPAADERVAVTRADLAASYLRLEEAYFAAPPEGARAREINQGFDRATMAFFTGRSGEALRQIDALTQTLREPAASAAERAAASLKLIVAPPVLSKQQPRAITLRLVSLYDAPLDAVEDVPITVVLRDPSGKIDWQKSVTLACGPAQQVDTTLAVDVEGASLAPGLHTIELLTDGPRRHLAGRLNVIDGPPLDAQRSENAMRLANIAAETPALQQALASCRARNELLSDVPSAANSAQFLADLQALAVEVRGEIAALEEGRDPYRRKAGDYWRVLATDKGEVPIRVFAPQAATGGQPVPLLIVLHGAGGDENMFPEAYGAGVVKEIAEQRGMLLVSPSTYRLGSAPARVAELVAALENNYAMDRDRVYVLGHSMGAGATAGLVRGNQQVVAAACCMAGGNNFQSAAGMPPLLVLLAELDGVVPAKSVTAAAERAISAGMPVELKVIPDYGHTLVVGRELAGAVDWLLRHRRPPAAESESN